MVTTEDIAEAVKALWTAATALSDPTTGLVKSLTFGRVPDNPTTPYATFKITDGDAQPIATKGYLQTFMIEFRTWGGTNAVNIGAIKAAMEAAFLIQVRTVLTLPNTRSLAILHCLKKPGGLDEDPDTKQNQSVKLSIDRFEILTQG